MNAEVEGATVEVTIYDEVGGVPEGGMIPMSTHSPEGPSLADADDVNVPYISIKFQSGTILSVGFNGVQIEDVLNILIERLERFQLSEMRCQENSDALEGLFRAKSALMMRTEKRRQQGVEGTNEPHI